MVSMFSRVGALLLISLVTSAPAAAQRSLPQLGAALRRPYLGPVVPPASFQRAIQQGTRTATGTPGPRYWQNFATYKIAARVMPETKRLEGGVEIIYQNNSPDTLHNLHLDLTQNFHRGDAERNERAEVTGGVDLRRITVGGMELSTSGGGPRYQVFGTRLVILPPAPVLPGGTATINIDYAFTIPQAGASGRMGWNRDNFLYLAYWYPQMAVYDDIVGWHPDSFTGISEFYAGFANYEYTIDLPTGWVLTGTGDLANAQQVLSGDVYQRLQRAAASDDVVGVITANNVNSATAPGVNGRLQWRFVADSVRDVAFSATRASMWDAVRTPVGDRDGDGQTDYARVDAIYRPTAPVWKHAARFGAHALSFHARNLGIPYPWSHMTAVEGEGIIGGGMEYPMMTLIGPYTMSGEQAFYAVVSHEIAHMWFPMLVSSDERRYTWLDEGNTAFNENEAERDFWKPTVTERFHIEDQESYLGLARAGEEGEVMRRSAFHYSPHAYTVASYDKPATALAALRNLLGNDLFYRAYREYAQRWKHKHPYPWDLWNTFENVSGRDLDWFWQAWYHTTWTLDQAVASVTTASGGTTITIEDRGQIPMPATLTITRANGERLTREIPVESWLSGATTATVTVPAGSPVNQVELDAARALPDVNRGNNVWRR